MRKSVPLLFLLSLPLCLGQTCFPSVEEVIGDALEQVTVTGGLAVTVVDKNGDSINGASVDFVARKYRYGSDGAGQHVTSEDRNWSTTTTSDGQAAWTGVSYNLRNHVGEDYCSDCEYFEITATAQVPASWFGEDESLPISGVHVGSATARFLAFLTGGTRNDTISLNIEPPAGSDTATQTVYEGQWFYTEWTDQDTGLKDSEYIQLFEGGTCTVTGWSGTWSTSGTQMRIDLERDDGTGTWNFVGTFSDDGEEVTGTMTTTRSGTTYQAAWSGHYWL